MRRRREGEDAEAPGNCLQALMRTEDRAIYEAVTVAMLAMSVVIVISVVRGIMLFDGPRALRQRPVAMRTDVCMTMDAGAVTMRGDGHQAERRGAFRASTA